MGERKIAACRQIAGLAILLAAPVAGAQNLTYDIGDLRLGFTGTFTTGALWRAESRSTNLLGKLNVPGQQGMCTADDCMSLTGASAPNQRLVDAAGSFGGGNRDNGDLNYDKHDVVDASSRFVPAFSMAWGDWRAKVRGILYYDPVNDNRNEYHPNTRFQPSRTRRPDNISRQFARGGELREAYISTQIPLGENSYTLTVGQQIISWGESLLTPLNTLNTINPPDAVLAHMPGFQLRDLYLPVPAISIGGNLGAGFSGSAFYQFLWRGAKPEPAGSFFSINDIIGGGRYATLGFGNYAEDAGQKFTPAGLTGLISRSSRTALVLPDSYGEPSNGGQYGFSLSYTAESLNDTEFAAYYANYHSRLPYISVVSADASCTRKMPAGTPADLAFAAATVACTGFNQSFNPLAQEPLPVDTMKVFSDYPEDIHMMGLSFNTNLGSWSLAGEYSYRPNMPLQIIASDMIFAGISPAFPRDDIHVPIDSAALIGVNSPFTIPGHRHAVPDFISAYRGLSEIAPDTVVHGYERFKVGQFSLLGIHIFGASDNPFGADQIQLLAEVSGTQIFNLPSLSRLQLQGTGDFTHFSPGADGTGSNGVPDSLRINPTQQHGGTATAFAWGYRIALRGQYSNVIGTVSLHPTLILFQGLSGISSATIDNYVAGRKTINLGVDADLAQNLSAGVQYQWFTGAGDNNLRSDRDNYGLHLSYSF